MSLKENNRETVCPVLYGDEHLLIVHKPEGVLSHPNPLSGKKTKTAFEGDYDFNRRCFSGPRGMVWLIHRLDQDTSGILLAARHETAAKKCRMAFEEGTIEKVYWALVAGTMPQKGIWSDHLSVKKKSGYVRAAVSGMKPHNAKLRYSVRKFFRDHRMSLLEIELLTGKTHQIRAQAAFRGTPVLGDEIYGKFALNRKYRKETGLRRLFLHACRLGLKHPVTGEWLRIEDPLPQKLEACLEALGPLHGKTRGPGKF